VTPEQRRQAIDFCGIRGTGMPIPTGHLPVSARAHVLNIYFESPVSNPVIFWRGRKAVVGSWLSQMAPTTTWKRQPSVATSWQSKNTPGDGQS